MRIFETIKPGHPFLQQYISYYYLDIADDEDYCNEYICYPHYNNTISLYKSHTTSLQNNHSIVSFEKDAAPLQIFTPLRENILKVTQRGPVFKVGIVFEPFGINQFLRKKIPLNERACSPAFHFFDEGFVRNLFNGYQFTAMANLLDVQLLKLFTPMENPYLTKAIEIFSSTTDEVGIDELAEVKLGISRKHLNRLFKRYIGVTAQKYRSIVRFRQLINCKLHQNEPQNLTALSHQVHYTDQSHFIKACKQLTGLTPSQFFKDGEMIGSEDTFWSFAR
ncbi:helix-turn-helix domain-containing protein [Pedobacter sp.]|uniref:helix-turn-helix domain-containing protein n=1 Tax=Pedobacter sp. TaxID=1411316 RepID=UPI0031DA5CDF